MASTETNYLQVCLKAFPKVIEDKYGTSINLAETEKSFVHLRRQTPLTYKDLEQFELPKNWWFKKFWLFPSEHHITLALKRKEFNFWQLPSNELTVITSLYEVFRSVELVSIILRFIRPEHYGIISPPVERMLDVRRAGKGVETYLNYIKDLRSICQNHQLSRVADADMALWVLHERCYGLLRDPEIEKAYFADSFILRLRTINRMSHLLENYSYADLSRALLTVNLELSAQLGGIAFERMVRQSEPKGADTVSDDQDLKSLIDQLHNLGVIDNLTRGRWHAARRTRNKAIHKKGKTSPPEVQHLLELLSGS